MTETEADRLYQEGYDDGYEGAVRTSTDAEYLQGYYDGLNESEDEDDYYDYDGVYYSYEDGEED